MDFSQYKKEDNPEKERKIYAWQTAIGLQKVDNLTPSKYLYHIAKENIENNLTFKEGLLHEDVLWSFCCACHSTKISVIKDITLF